MHTYPKIDTAFVRDEQFKVTSELRSPVVASIRTWHATEKIDGTNVRLCFFLDQGALAVEIAGRTDRAQLHPGLYSELESIARRVSDKVQRSMRERGLESFILFGEGYGNKIQSGGKYRPDQGFVLFDVLANDKWLPWNVVQDYAEQLDVDLVPDLGMMDWGAAVELVRRGFDSRIGTAQAEGLVLRTVEPLYDNRDRRVIAKLKTKDFR